MAITFDAYSVDTVYDGQSLTLPHTVAGTERLMMCLVFEAVGYAISAIDYNGDTMTLLQSLAGDGGIGTIHVYYLKAPDTGTHNLTVSFDNPAAYGYGIAVSFAGVNQTDTFGTVATAKGSASPATVDVSSASAQWVVDFVHKEADENVMTVGAGQTERHQHNDPTLNRSGGISTELGTTTTTMSWTFTNAYWASIGVPIKPSTVVAWRPQARFLG